MNDRHRVLLGAEIALVALTVVVTISLERLFTDLSFLPDLLILVVGSHIVAAVCRRAELSMAWATPISAAALVVLATAVFYPDASALIVPTPETLDLLGEDLREAWRTFSEDAAPVPPLRGFLVTTAVLVWYGVFLADWAAFRLRSPLEAVAPAASVFVFASLLGVDRNAVAHGLLFAAGLAGLLLTLRAERQVREEVWIADGARSGISTTLRVGAVAGAGAVLLGAFAAPQLPGAGDPPLVDVTNISPGPETRSVLSPLVEISTSLVTQSDVELFSVRVPEGRQDYWRLMALTEFKEEIWRRSSNFDEVRGPVGSNVDVSVDTRALRQEITIEGLGNIYLPGAYEVRSVIENGGVDLEYEVATGALVVERGRDEIPRGLTYIVESQVPDFAPGELPADATQGLDRGFVNEHTQLPGDCASGESAADTGCWPTRVTALAEQLTAGLTTDHERVLALQGFFLDPNNFTYDLTVALEHDIDDMESFLYVVNRGYCEQFASTFAAMARSIGIPARVAVGFTWGDWDPVRGAYVVSGKHAHAWPEVYFAGVGWVIFDPTPGRSRGHDGDITGLDNPEQHGSEPATTPDETPTTTEPGAPGPLDPGQEPPPGEPTPTTPQDTPDIVAVPVADDGSGRGPWIPALLVLLGALAVAGFVPAVQSLRRRARLRAVAADPIGRGELAWDDAVGALRLVGLSPRSDQTPHEFASMAENSTRDLGPVRELADHVTSLRYAADDDAVERAIAAQATAAAVVTRCRTLVGRPRVLRDVLDPRLLTGPPPAGLFG